MRNRKRFIWPVRVTANTTSIRKTRISINALIEGAGDAKGAILRYVLGKANAFEWYGVEVTGVTPLGQRVKVVIEPQGGWEQTSGFEYPRL